ncbi:MAG: YicC/YloC family endoribonuclease [Lutibacter sp.]|nr:YicC/YloC family endoribonuclease [Lutibacter sp.]
MIQSMTGYGKTVLQLPTKKVTIELRSLNSKNLDLSVRIPTCYREKELFIRKRIAKNLTRGKVDFSIYIEDTAGATSAAISEKAVRSYMDQLRSIVPTDEASLLKIAVRLPDALSSEREALDEQEWQAIEEGIVETLEKINQYRTDEGKVLHKDFELRIANIAALLSEVVAIDPERMKQVRARLEKSIADLKVTVDENRFEQELIYYLEKLDITEEKVRLQNHLGYFEETLQLAGSNGKKLAFIAQEIGREINTIGSKSNHAAMQKKVVQMKDELEKIKEQNLNVL